MNGIRCLCHSPAVGRGRPPEDESGGQRNARGEKKESLAQARLSCGFQRRSVERFKLGYRRFGRLVLAGQTASGERSSPGNID